MTYHYSATGERIEDEPDENQGTSVSREPQVRREPYRMPLDAEVVAHCNELRRILAESRARRQAVA